MIVWLIILIVTAVNSLPNGAPKTACVSLLPRHSGIPAQTTTAPYLINAKLSDNKVIVNITSLEGETFEGFILQARSSNDPSKFIDGEFTISKLSKAIDCFDSNQNTLTHANRSTKTEITAEWTPRENLNEEILFRATIAKKYDEFWTKVDSNPVKMRNDFGSVVKSEMLYEKCFKEEGCLGLPNNCIEHQNCSVLLRYSKSSDGINFNLQGNLQVYATNYIAMGWSEDPIMGKDSVTECLRDGTNVIARESWNEGKSNTRTKELPQNSYTGSFVDGVASCSWTSPIVTVMNGETYDFINKNYYVLLAAGEVSDELRLKYHDTRIASAEALNLTEFNVYGEISEPDVETSSRDSGDEQPPVTTPHETTASTSPKEDTTAGCSSYLKCPCLMFLFTGLIFATEESIIYHFFKYLF